MQTLTLLAQKGGTGKTTLCVHLAVHASQKKKRVALIDIDPQASAATWKKRRDSESPEILSAQASDLESLKQQYINDGYDYLIIDTAPHAGEDGKIASSLSDLTLIPSRPAVFDLDAIGASVKIVKSIHAKAFILLNACPPPNRHGEALIVREAREALEGYGLDICPCAVSLRAALGHALIAGQAVTEFDQKGKAATEINTLWKWIERQW